MLPWLCSAGSYLSLFDLGYFYRYLLFVFSLMFCSDLLFIVEFVIVVFLLVLGFLYLLLTAFADLYGLLYFSLCVVVYSCN